MSARVPQEPGRPRRLRRARDGTAERRDNRSEAGWAAGSREELHSGDSTQKAMTFHDLRATGLTWMAVRGDDPLKIMQRAGHADFKTTQGYVREAEAVREGFGEPFPVVARERAERSKRARGRRQIFVGLFGARDRAPVTGAVTSRSSIRKYCGADGTRSRPSGVFANGDSGLGIWSPLGIVGVRWSKLANAGGVIARCDRVIDWLARYNMSVYYQICRRSAPQHGAPEPRRTGRLPGTGRRRSRALEDGPCQACQVWRCGAGRSRSLRAGRGQDHRAPRAGRGRETSAGRHNLPSLGAGLPPDDDAEPARGLARDRRES